MTAVVVAETLVLALLVLLVGGLLRSHAEILRRLDELQPGGTAQAAPVRASSAAHDVSGVTLTGDAVHLGLTRPGSATLLAFLTSGCSTCPRVSVAWANWPFSSERTTADAGAGTPARAARSRSRTPVHVWVVDSYKTVRARRQRGG